MEKIFNDLESLNAQDQENAKRELAECFASSEYLLRFREFLIERVMMESWKKFRLFFNMKIAKISSLRNLNDYVELKYDHPVT